MVMAMRYTTVAIIQMIFLVSTAVAADDWTSNWERWSDQAHDAVSRRFLRIVASELDMDGTVRRRREIPLDADGRPTIERTRADSSRSRFSDYAGAPSGEDPDTHVSTALFDWDWGTVRFEPLIETRHIHDVESVGVRVSGGGNVTAYGEVWYRRSDFSLLETKLYPAGAPFPYLETRYRSDERQAGALRLERVRIESLTERGILADRIRRLTLDYQ